MPRRNDRPPGTGAQQPGKKANAVTPPAPAGSHLGAFAYGLRVIVSIPAALLFSAGLGFGALARDGGISVLHTAIITGGMYALPNQVLLVDQLARNETLIAAAVAVALAGLRLLPMTITLTPLLKGSRPQASRTRRLLETLAVHFVAVSPWVEALRRLPTLPPDLRLAGHLGLGLAFWIAMMTGALTGYAVAGSVPPAVSATLLFLTPIYFLLSLLATAGSRMDLIAIGLGCGLAPVLYVAAPGFDLLATGLIGGTLAFLLGGRGS